MKTRNGYGEEIKLQYPDGIISWLSGFESDYDGSKAIDGGNEEAYTDFALPGGIEFFKLFFRNFVEYLAYIMK